jgi:hypothetical protein
MEPTKIASFIRGLKNRSAKDDVEWLQLGTDKYGIQVKDVLVTIEPRESASEFDEWDMIISFRDSSTGDLIVEFSDVELRDHLDHSFRMLRSLYEEARLSVTGYKKKLDKALEVFAKDDPENDIPF